MSVSSYVSFPPVSSLATMDTLDKIDKAFTIVAKILMFLGALLLGWVKAKPEKRQVMCVYSSYLPTFPDRLIYLLILSDVRSYLVGKLLTSCL